MKGPLKGLKGRFVHSNSRAFFTLCDCQKLIALLGDVAKCMREIMLPLRCNWGFCSSGILHSIILRMFVGISEQNTSPIFNIQAVKEECRKQMDPLLYRGCCERILIVLEVNETIRSLEHKVATQM